MRRLFILAIVDIRPAIRNNYTVLNALLIIYLYARNVVTIKTSEGMGEFAKGKNKTFGVIGLPAIVRSGCDG